MKLKQDLSEKELYRPCVFQAEELKKLSHRKLEIFGQSSALQALKFGLEVGNWLGYNIFCSGAKGVGRTSLSMACIKQKAAHQKTPDDLCFVTNFDVSYRPNHLFVPAGQGQILVKEMTRAIDQIKQRKPSLYLGW